MDDYNKQIEAYSKAVDDYNAYIEKWNAGPRTSDPTMKPPAELPFTQATLDKFSESAAQNARDTASQRELALAVAANPEQYGLSGFGFADGGSVSSQAFNKMFPQKFVVGGAALAAQNAAARMAAMAPASEVTDQGPIDTTAPFLPESVSNFIGRYAADNVSPVDMLGKYYSVISGGVISPEPKEVEKVDPYTNPGLTEEEKRMGVTPSFQPPTLDTDSTSLPAAEQLPTKTALPAQPQSTDDFIMRILDAAPATAQLEAEDKRRKLEAEDLPEQEIEDRIWKENKVWKYGDIWLEELPSAKLKEASEWSTTNKLLGQKLLDTTELTYSDSGNEEEPVLATLRDKESNSIISLATGKTKTAASTSAYGQALQEMPGFDTSIREYQAGKGSAQVQMRNLVENYDELFKRYPEIARQYANIHARDTLPGTGSTSGRFKPDVFEAMGSEKYPNFAPSLLREVNVEGGGKAEILEPRGFAAYQLGTESANPAMNIKGGVPADVVEHEVQHNVFEQLGLPGGSSTRQMDQLLTFYLRPRIMELRGGAEPKYEGEMDDLMKTYDIAMAHQSPMQELMGVPSPEALYIADPGEAAARLAQFRQGMTEEQKAAESPGATYRGQDYRAKMMKDYGFTLGQAATRPMNELVPARVIEDALAEMPERMKNWGK